MAKPPKDAQQEWLAQFLTEKFQQQELAIQQMLDAALQQPEHDDNVPVDVGRRRSMRVSERQISPANAEKDQGSFNEDQGPIIDMSKPSQAQLQVQRLQREISMKSGSLKTSEASGAETLDVRHPRLTTFITGPLDVAMAIVVCIHIFFMIATIQLEEGASRFSLGLSPDSGNATGWHEFFYVMEYVFFFIYLIDVTIRVFVQGSRWLFDSYGNLMVMNVFDATLVVIGANDLFVLPFILGTTVESHTRGMRAVKMLRMLRTLRIVKTVSGFRQVRVLIASFMASVGALMWSMVLLLVAQLGFALVICQALQGFIQDEHADFEARLQMYGLYGSFVRALYTMFEITYSGGWPGVVRPVIEKVGAWYALPFLAYVALVVFAAIRIVTALFLKETLEATAHDAEIAIEGQLHAGSKLLLKLQVLFQAFDADGDGHLSPKEWESALSVPYIQHYLQTLDVRVADCRRLFEILDDGDGFITVSEFCNGIKKIKGQARAVDMVVLQNATEKLMKECKAIRQELHDRKSYRRRASLRVDNVFANAEGGPSAQMNLPQDGPQLGI